MNVFITPNALFLFATLGGCIQEASVPVEVDEADTDEPADTGTSTPADTGDAEESDDAYTVEDGVLTLKGEYNAMQGQTLGLFGDGFGTEDGFSEAVATIPAQSNGDVPTNLAAFGTGQSYRFGWATLVVDGDAPDDWLLESVAGENVADHDSLGLTVLVDECGVRKLNFCVRLTSSGDILPGECALTYQPPEGCEDEDNDGDTDPDADDADTDSSDDPDTDDTDCAGDCAVDDDGDGYSENEGDCDDGWSGTNPGHDDEWRDGQDNDCDGSTDEGCDGSEAWNGYCSP